MNVFDQTCADGDQTQIEGPCATGQVREALPEDIPALVSIEEACFISDRLSRRSFRHLITEGNSVTLIDNTADQARGYVTLLFRADVSLARVYSIATAPGWLGKGVASGLLRAAEQFQETARALLTQFALILVQEYMYTDFDWRIGELNRKAIFASKYFMSKHHWQIAKRDAGGQAKLGAARAVPLDEVPQDLLAYAVAAANLIGDGLYGVDMKMTERGPVVIEVNDNPNIDAGNEDSVLRDEMYRIVLRDLVRRLDVAHGLPSAQLESST